MSSIWNPQDRFILSNMTSEKLYAKSPLTTGVSGTSAWLGLEPSATYNETVLWEGSYTPVNDGYIDLSGSLSAYDKISFVINGFSTFMPQNYEYTFLSGGDKTVPIVAFGIPGEGGVRINTCKATCNNAFNRLTFTVCKQENIIGTSVSTGTFNSVISKVIGINRKEV